MPTLCHRSSLVLSCLNGKENISKLLFCQKRRPQAANSVSLKFCMYLQVFTTIHSTLRASFKHAHPFAVDVPSFGCPWGFNLCYNNCANPDVSNWLPQDIDTRIESCISGMPSSKRALLFSRHAACTRASCAQEVKEISCEHAGRGAQAHDDVEPACHAEA
jgi:hypothetical protein